jgi:hypothetical protein
MSNKSKAQCSAHSEARQQNALGLVTLWVSDQVRVRIRVRVRVRG